MLPLLVPFAPVQPASAVDQPVAVQTRSSELTTAPTGAGPAAVTGAPLTTTSSTDYPPAAWVPASASNYTVANRAHDYPIDMIVIHDIEGSYNSAIQMFQDPARHGSAHYIVGYKGQATQMVLEKNVAWHAGNWDYNTRSIGIEHEGFAYTYGLYTNAEYVASARIAASICSRWGVPMDRQHVIGHNQVPDPDHAGLFGGTEHHTDPGPYWNWTYYMALAKKYAATLPSPPHMMPDPLAVNGLTSATVTWAPAHTCHLPISGYTVVIQPGGMTVDVPAGAPLSATFNGLQIGVGYTFSVTATNADGSDTASSNTVIAGACTGVSTSASPSSPILSGGTVTVTAAASICPDPLYEFWVLAPGAKLYTLAQGYSSSPTYSWRTSGLAIGTYRITVWARDGRSSGESGNRWGRWDAYNANLLYTLVSDPCNAVTEAASPAFGAMVGIPANVTAGASGCPDPLYEFWLLAPGAHLYELAQAYSTNPIFSWTTAGLATGTYRINVWVRDASSLGVFGNSSGSWDTYNANLAFQLTTGCPAVTDAASPPSPAPAGAPVSFTASAPGCPNPHYEFWVQAPGASLYKLAQAYSTNAVFNWKTTDLARGTYRITAWVRDASSPGVFSNTSGTWDAYTSTSFNLS